MTELLAPVGSRDALTAAIESGANAVYLGGKMFGARHYAPNFTDEELAEAVRSAHLRRVLVYVTVNTLLDNSELPALIEYLRYLYQIGVDAIIVQDVGVARVAKTVVPNLDIHASTQMTIHNLEGVKLLAEYGFTRVVLARELSLDEIRYICENSSLEIEVFIHGALCISYSGQCLMSSLIGGRSGNRGKCAQPCRLPYELVDENGQNLLQANDAGEYLLSPKDFNTLELLPQLIDAGVASFKIEGRMKRPEYVAVVVDTYRRTMDSFQANKIDAETQLQDQKDLAQIFNRGFTTAYLKGKPGRNMMSDRRPNNRGVRLGRVISYFRESKSVLITLDEPLFIGDIVEFWVKVGGRVSADITSIKWNGREVQEAPAGAEVLIPVNQPVRQHDRLFKVFDARLMARARSFFEGPKAVLRIPITMTVTAVIGRPLRIRVKDEDGYSGEAQSEFVAEPALKRPLNEEVIRKQVERLGNTIFQLKNLTCEITGEVMVPISEINETRRKAVENLELDRLARFTRPELDYKQWQINEIFPIKQGAKTNKKPDLVVNVDTVEKVKAALAAGADWIMFGGETFHHLSVSDDQYKEVLQVCQERNCKVVFSIPRLVKQWQMSEVEQLLRFFEKIRPDAVAVANLGALHAAKNMVTLPLHGDYPLNVYNAAAIAFYQGAGLDSITLSPELTFGQVEKLVGYGTGALECIVHGYLTLMISEYCAMGSFLSELHTGRCQQVCMRGNYWLKDRKGERFPVATDQFCRMHILNAKELSMLPHVFKLAGTGIDRIRVEAKKSSSDYTERITSLYRRLLDAGRDWDRFQSDIEAIEHPDVTRGHYFRGVL
jgi:putative protease